MANPLSTSDRVIDFTLVSADGVTLSSTDARQHGLLLYVFWKRTCGTCQFAFPYLQRFQDLYATDGFTFWGIAQEPALQALEFAEKFGATFPLLVDEALDVTEQYDLISVPSIYLTDETGEILEHSAGFSTEVYNRIARRAAERTGKPYIPIVRPEDGAPSIKPG